MGKDYHDLSPELAALFDRAGEVVGFDLKKVCFEGPEERLNETDVSQPAIYVTGVATYRAAVKAGYIDPDSNLSFAGLSLGEYTALHLGGAFSFEDGLKLVAARGRYMQQAAVAVPSGMVALIGTDETHAQAAVNESAKGEVLVLANFNAPGQIVAGGAIGACNRLVENAAQLGIKAIPLKVAGAFHSPLMQPAADLMRQELDKVDITATRRPVWSNVTAAVHTTPDDIRRLLVDQIVKPVLWEQTMKQLVADEQTRFIELAPGRVLTGLLKKINRRTPVDSLAAASALTATSGEPS